MDSSKAGNVSFIDLTKDDNTEERSDTKISTVSECVGCSAEIARSLLVRSDWDVNQAVEDFYHDNESWSVPSAADGEIRIRTVMDLTGCRHEIARNLLEYNNWDLDKVVKDVYGSPSDTRSRKDLLPISRDRSKMENSKDINYVKTLECSEQEHEEGKDCGVKCSKVRPSRSFVVECNQQEHKVGEDCGVKRQ